MPTTLFPIYSLVFILGTVFGSFLSVVIYRVPKEKTIAKGRSMCPHCGHVLSPIDLVPLVSYVLMRGACRYCKTHVSTLYPILELITGISFVLAAILSFGAIGSLSFLPIITFIYLATIFAVFIALFFIDLYELLLPDVLVFFGVGVAVVYQLIKIIYALPQADAGILIKPLLYSIGIGLGVAAFFLFLIIITRGKGMGGGDVKLAILLGLVNGWPNTIVAFFLAFLSGAIISVGLLALRKKKFTSVVPFGPFLIAGSVVALLWGDQLVDFYLHGVLG